MTVEENFARYSPEYIKYIRKVHKDVNEMRERMMKNCGFKWLDITPNIMTFEEYNNLEKNENSTRI